MPGKCLTNRLIYKATVAGPNISTESYTGVTKNTFKQRYYGHSSSFRNREQEFSTTLSAHIWRLKDQEQDFDIRWQVIDRGGEFNPTTRKCLLRIKGKYHIRLYKTQMVAALTRDLSFFVTCKHRTKNLLSNI